MTYCSICNLIEIYSVRIYLTLRVKRNTLHSKIQRFLLKKYSKWIIIDQCQECTYILFSAEFEVVPCKIKKWYVYM